MLLHPGHILQETLHVALQQHLAHEVIQRHDILGVVDKQLPEHLVNLGIVIQEVILETELPEPSIQGVCIHQIVMIEQFLRLQCPVPVENGVFQQSEMLGGRLILSVDDQAFHNPLGEASAFAGIKYRLLQVKHVSECGVDHPKMPKSLSRWDIGCQIAHHRHDERIFPTLIIIKHAICKSALLGKGQIDTITGKSVFHLIIVSALDQFTPTLMPHQIILTDQFIFLPVIAIDSPPACAAYHQQDQDRHTVLQLPA